MSRIDARTFRTLKRAAFRIERGLLAGVRDLRSRLRLRGAGELAGQSETGSMREYDQILSLRERKPVYRLREIAVEQNFQVVLDVRCCDGPRARARFVAVADALLGILLAIPDATVRVGVFGTRGRVRPFALCGIKDWGFARQSIERAVALPADPAAPLGALRQILGVTEDQHRVVVTYWTQPHWLVHLAAPLGTSLVVPERPADAERRGGVVDLGSVAGPRASVRAAFEARQNEALATAEGLRFRCARVALAEDPIEALAAASRARRWRRSS